MSTTLPTTEAEKQAFFANIVAQYSERLYWTVRRIVITPVRDNRVSYTI